MTKENILDKIKKLLSLATNNSNANEAAVAAAQAQALMSRHAIDALMLETPVEEEEKIEKDVLSGAPSKKRSMWKGQLAMALCGVNMCKVYTQQSHEGYRFMIIGRPSDAATVRYMFLYLVREIERLCDLAAHAYDNPGKTWCNNFKIAAVDTIAERLREVHAATRTAMRQEANTSDTLGTGAALVRLDTALAKRDQIAAAVELYGKQRLKLKPSGRSHDPRPLPVLRSILRPARSPAALPSKSARY